MSTSDYKQQAELAKAKLATVSPSMCLAKWNQVSLHLPTGLTNSCYHPPLHKIDAEAVKTNPAALHNTSEKLDQRFKMLQGERPDGCSYCWKMEDTGEMSDRHYRSGEPWAMQDFEAIKQNPMTTSWTPRYVEVNFNHACNFKCSYCSPQFSTTWGKETDRYGEFPTTPPHNAPEHFQGRKRPIPNREKNPYVDAFWKWWPNLFPTLHTFRVTGGEPILHKDMFKVLDYIIENPKVNPMIEMSVNSNLCAPQDMVEEFIDKVKFITENDLVWNFALFTSIESWGAHAEYMRDGMDTERFWNNLDMFLTKCEKPEATIMATYNLTSVPTYNEVIKRVFEIKKEHYNGKRYRHYSVILDTSYLRQPEFLQIRLLSTKWIDKIRQDVELMESLSEEKYTHIYGHGHCGFYDFEREKLRRLLDWVDAPLDDVNWLIKMRKDFILFIDEYDKRRGKNFKETFPEMIDFYDMCKGLL